MEIKQWSIYVLIYYSLYMYLLICCFINIHCPLFIITYYCTLSIYYWNVNRLARSFVLILILKIFCHHHSWINGRPAPDSEQSLSCIDWRLLNEIISYRSRFYSIVKCLIVALTIEIVCVEAWGLILNKFRLGICFLEAD